jgi:hypothetical protein
MEITMSVLDFLHVHAKSSHAMERSMTNQTHPNYGNGVLAIAECERIAKELLERLPSIEAWMAEYAANRRRLWLLSMLEIGTGIVQGYSSHSIWRNLVAPTLSPLSSWSRIEAVYKGPLDVRYSAALENSYAVAKRLREIPERHEGPCTGGFVCFGCEDDEWRWSQTVHREADMPLNIFWRPHLQSQFLGEILGLEWEVPENWSFPSGEPSRQWIWKPTGRTPFQYARELVQNAASRWYIWIKTDEYEIYKGLLKLVPGLREDIPKILSACQEVRAMY